MFEITVNRRKWRKFVRQAVATIRFYIQMGITVFSAIILPLFVHGMIADGASRWAMAAVIISAMWLGSCMTVLFFLYKK